MNKHKTKCDNAGTLPLLFDPADMVDYTLWFLKEEKNMYVDTVEDLEKAREWVSTTDPDNLMIGEPNGDSFDKMIGAIRRPMLLEAIDIKLNRMKATISEDVND